MGENQVQNRIIDIINEQFRQVIRSYVSVLILNQEEAKMMVGEEQ